MTVRIALLAPLVLSLWPAPALPQTPPATAIPNPQSPRIVTKVEEVSLDLVVRNKKGKLVSDLNPADLEILDGGAPAKISDLHLVNGSPSGSIVTLVFDPLEAAAARQARDAALQLLKLAPASSISFAVLEVQGRLRLFQEFTSNRESLKRAIDAATGMIKTNPEKESAAAEKQLIQTARGASEAPSRTLAQVTLTALEQSPHIARDQHTKPSMSGLLALARAQQRLAGRKAIVYFAQGLTLDSSGKDLLKSVISAANRAGLSIYAVDVNGLDSKASEGLMAALTMASAVPSASNSLQRGGAPPSTDDVLVTPGMRTNIDEQMGRIEMSGLAPDQNSLSNLSASTGGIYIPGVENPRKSLRRMLEDLTSYYEVSYVPATPDDGRFRNVTVKPRHSGLIVRAPRGYYALVSGGSPIRPFEEPLLKALAAPQLPSNLQFRSAVLHFGETAFGNANSLVVEVPLSEVEIRDDQNTNLFAAHISILAQIRNTSGAIVEHFSEDIPRQGALEAEEQAQLETLTMQRHFTADSGQYVLETVVMDHNSGKLSAKRAAFEIPAASAGPALSDVLLVQRTQPLSADADPTEPLRYENALVIPNLSGRVPRDAKNVSLFFLLYPDPRSSEKPDLQMELRRDGKSVGRVSLQMRPEIAGEPVAYMANVQSSSLAPGRYQMVAILTQGGSTAERSAPFTLDGPELASAAAKTVPRAEPSESDLRPLSPISSKESKLLVITPASVAIPPPPSEELQAILAGARQRASDYTDSLPNLICVEVIDRSVDPTGTGNWRHKDNIAELLRYHDKIEQRTTLQVNGMHTHLSPTDLKGTISHGEFGALLNAVFNRDAKANFRWQETDALGSGTLQVFAYRVARENSSFAIIASNGRQIKTAFHGLAYIDSTTRGVRRLTVEADDLPTDFPTHSASMAVDYGYIAISDHDYLLPIAGTVTVKEHKRLLIRNEIEFRDYKRYGAESSIRFDR